MSKNGKGARFLRERARYYRELASQDDDPDRAALLRELAETLEREARVMEEKEE